MAAHNQVRVLGYLLSDPAIYEDETGDTDTDAYEVVPGDEVENTLRKYRKESLLS